MGEYDKLKANKENYIDFLDKLRKGIESLSYEGLGLIGHGSVFREKYVPGVSDIDMILVYPEDVVTDKEKTRKLSGIIADALDDNPIEFQISPIDATLIREPLFNALGKSWQNYRENGNYEILKGRYDLAQFRFLYSAPPELATVGHNLRKARKALLLSDYYFDKDYERFFKGFFSTLKTASTAAKQLNYILTGNLEPDRFSGIDFIEREFPNLDSRILRGIEIVYQNPKDLIEIRDNPEFQSGFWGEVVTFFEKLIKEFITKYKDELRRFEAQSEKGVIPFHKML